MAALRCSNHPAWPLAVLLQPRLAELGIDIPAIISRTRSILLLRLAGHDMDSLDLGGPLIFMAILGLSHLLVRGFVCLSLQRRCGNIVGC